MRAPLRFDYATHEVAPYINWVYFFHAWGMEPRFATVAHIHCCPSCQASWIASFPEAERPKAHEAAKLYTEATVQLRKWGHEPMCHALVLLGEAYSDGDDIIIEGKRFPFLRQQHAGRSGYTLCLSDFIRCGPITHDATAHISHTIGVFATSATLPQSEGNTHEQHAPLLASTLVHRLAEAMAEKVHLEVRKHHWGYAPDEQLTIRELHSEQFQGIRPAVGYPSLPDHSINFLIDELLGLQQIGITLTTSGAMSPSASVSGFMFAHPQARYFSVGNIGDDQLHDYSLRRGLESDTLRSFLTSSL